MSETSATPQTLPQLTTSDIYTVRILLSSFLPVELIDIILDEADYWSHSRVEASMCRKDYGLDDGTDYGEIFLFTMPLAHPDTVDHQVASKISIKRGEHPCRRIVFELHSRDKGWSDYPEQHGTYDRTRSWFDVSIDDPHGFIFAFGLLPPSAPADSATNRTVEAISDRDLQRNVHAKAGDTRHVIVWDWKDTIKDGSPEALEAERMGGGWRSMDGEFVRGMKDGDQIALWMNAIEQGWVCRVSRAIVTIYWAV
ncbi:hypothetical protein CONPUDRAFT_131665 [Coniophora puteana RWD-64-598 SS2]|uniref:Uncharacterized protein n=1 Tax=Coniophora puteana (strain RWD-64-598) TaxID=741705 RepID=A0A5M3M8N2_CONPW|nr:uncharacterized protein CONPUDRAFT_131665 [Coniophora puteana RWD-64-598 SS2]EIW75423.1 hypothetical protein CONPUDRAFT_131665 [Coniophora puteana RWD-64-598 SS2]